MSERERMWDTIVAVRDAYPRAAEDADTHDIITALLAAGFGDKRAAWDEGASAYQTRRWRDESLPLTNPYRTTTNGELA